MSAALKYHDATKHSEISLRTSAHYLDWENKPSPFKVYKNLPAISLPHNFPYPREESLNAIRGRPSDETGLLVDIQSLTEVLFFSSGLTRRMRMGSESYYMRAASATGALYPIDLYVVSAGISGLAPGVYHFNPFDFALIEIRKGDYSAELAAATGDATAWSPVTIVLTSLAWRNAWKYEARSYRHWFWDAGVIAANLLATCSSEGLPVRLVMSFVDEDVDQLLGLEHQKEATVALALIGKPRTIQDQPVRKSIQHFDLQLGQSPKEEVDYPVIWQTNAASALNSQTDVETWRRGLKPKTVQVSHSGPTFPIQPSKRDSPSLKEVILRRGSTRRFAQKPISFETLSTIIDASTISIPLDFLPDETSLIEFYFVANDVEGLASGPYHYDSRQKSIEQLKEGKLRYVSGYLCLEQLLFSDASVVFFLMTNLGQALRDLGNRGYRAAQFEAGIRAGKIYLSAYAMGIGASGSTFYDDAVTEFFSPHGKDMTAMIAVGVGVPAYKARPGRILPQFQVSRQTKRS